MHADPQSTTASPTDHGSPETAAPPAPQSDFSAPAGLLREYLRGRSTPCPGCGYDLCDLTDNRCPECGQALVLRVNLVEPRFGQLLAAILGLSAGAATGVVVLAVVIAVSVWRNNWPNRGDEFWCLVVLPTLAVVLQTPPLLALSRQRGRTWFRSRSRAQRDMIVAGAWASTALLVGLWIAIVLA